MESKEKPKKKSKTREKRAQSNQREKKYSKLSSLAWALKNLWKIDARLLILAIVVAPLYVLLSLVHAYFPKALIDGLEKGVTFERLFVISAGFLALITFLYLFQNWLENRCLARRYYPSEIYQTRMKEAECETDYENTEKEEYHRITGYAWGDACCGRASVEFIWEDVSNMIRCIFGISTVGALMAMLHPLIFIITAAVAGVSYFTARMQDRYYEKHKQHWEKEDRKKNYLQNLSEDFSKAKDIKLYGMADWLAKMMRDYQAYVRMWNRRCRLRGVISQMLAAGMALLQDGVTYAVLIGMLFSGSISVGEFVFYFSLVEKVANYLEGIISNVASLSARADKIAYYRAFFDYENHMNHGKGCALPKTAEIELKDVYYRYEGAKEDTLKGINLKIRAGEKIALVGVNGAGKTTLVKLLSGFYRPSKGEILVGGKKIEEYNIKEYYSMISAVYQEVQKVAFSIFEYVASADLQRKSAKEDAIAAMKAAGIYKKVESLPNGMETHLMKGIYEDGVDFSGGEMQKLVLARAIYKDGKILILDEPTSALDPIAESELYLKYKSLTEDKTSIYISHRFASTRFCDRIILLADGKIIESGNHEQLMKKNGEYAHMFHVQSKYYKEESHAQL